MHSGTSPFLIDIWSMDLLGLGGMTGGISYKSNLSIDRITVYWDSCHSAKPCLKILPEQERYSSCRRRPRPPPPPYHNSPAGLAVECWLILCNYDIILHNIRAKKSTPPPNPFAFRKGQLDEGQSVTDEYSRGKIISSWLGEIVDYGKGGLSYPLATRQATSLS
jgi:hypothetical protein